MGVANGELAELRALGVKSGEGLGSDAGAVPIGGNFGELDSISSNGEHDDSGIGEHGAGLDHDLGAVREADDGAWGLG